MLDVGADQFRQRVAEQALGGRIGRLDRPPLVDGDDAVDRGVEDGPVPGLAVAQGRLGPLGGR